MPVVLPTERNGYWRVEILEVSCTRDTWCNALVDPILRWIVDLKDENVALSNEIIVVIPEIFL
jgi:hypothetical protein